jgi:S1-C subfamily serine protease
LLGLVLIIVAPAASAQPSPLPQFDPSVRSAVVRIEVAADPTSFAPDLSAELAARQPWTPYEAELAHRLRVISRGTGFLVNRDGFLVTSSHVVLTGVRRPSMNFTRGQWDSLSRLQSVLRDVWVIVGEGDAARSYLATPVIVDEGLDLAVLRVDLPPSDQTRFTPLSIASSDTLRIGQPVLALGFPEEDFEATSGEILSLIHGARVHDEIQTVRRVDPETGEETITVSGTSAGPLVRLHHSAPTGHGSSGGPVLDSRNAVVGVAYAILSERAPTTGNSRDDLNLAIAANVLKQFLRAHAISFTEAAP